MKPAEGKRAAVLLASYNGAGYIRTQIDSILAQEGVRPDLYVWDDGSTDGTREILREYERENANVHVTYGEKNLGYPECFYALTDREDIDADDYFFADQDDRWYPDKMRRGMEALAAAAPGKPAAYYAAYDLCDGELNRIRTVAPAAAPIRLRNTLYEVCGLEFTMAVNREAFRLLKAYRPRRSRARGTWMSMLYAALGEIVTDPRPCAAYRRHEASVTNRGTSRRSLWKWRAGKFKKQELAEYRSMLREFEEIAGPQLSAEDARTLRRFTAEGWFPNAFRKVFYPRRLRGRGTDEAALRLLFLLGWL